MNDSLGTELRTSTLQSLFPLRAELGPGSYIVKRDESSGLVTVARTGETMWLDCPECGTRAPVLANRTRSAVMYGNGAIGWSQITDRFGLPVWNVRYEVGRLVHVVTAHPKTGKPVRGLASRCECGFWARLRIIRSIGTEGRGKVRDGRWYCSGACLNGRLTCDCRCMGECHGAGKCEGH
jgi:hypothetical protein